MSLQDHNRRQGSFSIVVKWGREKNIHFILDSLCEAVYGGGNQNVTISRELNRPPAQGPSWSSGWTHLCKRQGVDPLQNLIHRELGESFRKLKAFVPILPVESAGSWSWNLCPLMSTSLLYPSLHKDFPMKESDLVPRAFPLIAKLEYNIGKDTIRGSVLPG